MVVCSTSVKMNMSKEIEMSVIPKSSLFATPESLEQLDQMIRTLPANQRSVAYHYTMLAFNLANKLVEDKVCQK